MFGSQPGGSLERTKFGSQEGLIMMVSQRDQEQLDRAAELVRDVIARHRGEDLRAITVLNEAIQDIRVGTRYLRAFTRPATP
jgi:hypothetical protein